MIYFPSLKDDFPSLKDQFVRDNYLPLCRGTGAALTMKDRFELARQHYEQQHGHQCPISYKTFEREYYRGVKKRIY